MVVLTLKFTNVTFTERETNFSVNSQPPLRLQL